MLVDTDILIWYLRGDREAADFLRECRPLTISVVTYIELVQGMRNKHELLALRRTIRNRCCKRAGRSPRRSPSSSRTICWRRV